jgi:hypothetical protein
MNQHGPSPLPEFQTQTCRFGPYPGLIAEGRAALGAMPEHFWFDFNSFNSFLRSAWERTS